MASYSIGSVRSAINTILAAITSIQAVYNYPNPEIEGYPAAIFVMEQEDGSMLDTQNNTRILTFKIWVICEIPEKGLTAADALLDSVSTDVINALEKSTNQTLAGACDWMMPVMGTRQQVASPEGNLLYQELNLKVYIASNIA